ncbi:family 43 glycosylhydrolase [Mucilaginibacter sp. JRF]|uniref:family 43 glycosylhydrolase n=1 Tax=Mucilaginibacter sp. JRF TaxID=2780088 RepID=UPI001880B33B|nr:family 43 glycosylhydrolase [Mucilaginibacter sp. JRF]MBE9586059.1 family 43 glycosylhydrolase [Mucilaginibacter sp. JRF]
MVLKRIIYYLAGLFALCGQAFAQNSEVAHKALSPLYRDPMYDGAADPIVVYNKDEKLWMMLYTQRRANAQTQDVAYCYGTPIGVATSKDHGQTWAYRGTLKLDFERGTNTFWAPEVIYDNGTYHMFVTYIQGVYNHWAGNARLVHYTSKNLWDWKFLGDLKLAGSIIDPTLMKLPDGKWHIWYKGPNANTLTAESSDLINWKADPKVAIGGPEHEGPKIFRFKDYYWMITDEWHGQRVHRSKDAKTWERQGMVLDKPGHRPEDTPTGAHADVVVTGGHAYIVYFTHPGRKSHQDDGGHDADDAFTYSTKRTSIHVAELEYNDGTLLCDRDKPFDFYLP